MIIMQYGLIDLVLATRLIGSVAFRLDTNDLNLSGSEVDLKIRFNHLTLLYNKN